MDSHAIGLGRAFEEATSLDRTYQMSIDAFNILLDLLREDLMTSAAMQHGGYRDTDAVEPEFIMAISI